MLRPDISKAIESVPAPIGEQIIGPAAAALEFLNTHLANDETVGSISSAAAKKGGVSNSVLAITDRRLIFVSPAPQAVAWHLARLTKSQVYGGYFFIEGDAGEYSLGLADDDWGTTFEREVKLASAVAVLSGR